MKKIARRNKMKIYGDLLSIFEAESARGKIGITRVKLLCNVPFVRLKEYILDLAELGLIESEQTLVLTEKGRKYIEEYQKILDFMSRMGMKYKI